MGGGECVVGCVAGRIEVKVTNVTTLYVLMCNVGCLGKVGVFGPSDCFCIGFRGIGKLAGSDPIFTSNFHINVIHSLCCSCARPNGIITRVSISPRLHVPGKDATRLTTRVLNNMGVGLLLTGGPQRGCRVKSAVPNILGGKVVRGITAVVPRMRGVLPGLSSVLTSLGIVLTSPTVPTALRGMRSLATDVTIADHRLRALVGSSVPRLANGLGAVKSGFTLVSGGLGRVSCTTTVRGMSTALGGMGVVASGLGRGSGAIKLLLGSPSLCGGLGTAATGTTDLLRSLGSRPGQCIRFSLFNGGSGWGVSIV